MSETQNLVDDDENIEKTKNGDVKELVNKFLKKLTDGVIKKLEKKRIKKIENYSNIGLGLILLILVLLTVFKIELWWRLLLISVISVTLLILVLVMPWVLCKLVVDGKSIEGIKEDVIQQLKPEFEREILNQDEEIIKEETNKSKIKTIEKIIWSLKIFNIFDRKKRLEAIMLSSKIEVLEILKKISIEPRLNKVVEKLKTTNANENVEKLVNVVSEKITEERIKGLGKKRHFWLTTCIIFIGILFLIPSPKLFSIFMEITQKASISQKDTKQLVTSVLVFMYFYCWILCKFMLILYRVGMEKIYLEKKEYVKQCLKNKLNDIKETNIDVILKKIKEMDKENPIKTVITEIIEIIEQLKVLKILIRTVKKIPSSKKETVEILEEIFAELKKEIEIIELKEKTMESKEEITELKEKTIESKKEIIELKEKIMESKEKIEIIEQKLNVNKKRSKKNYRNYPLRKIK